MRARIGIAFTTSVEYPRSSITAAMGMRDVHRQRLAPRSRHEVAQAAREHNVRPADGALDLEFSIDVVKAIPILARTAGLLAHLAEEREQPLGFLLADAAEEAVTYEPPPAS